MAPATQTLPLPCLMLLLLCRAPGAQTGQNFKMHQPQDKVSVRAGETLTLNCILSGTAEPGPVKWLKGWGSESKTIYDDRGTYPRVTRKLDLSNTDFSIHIRNVQPEDIGIYYCVKFQILLGGGIEVLRRGSGTEVSVHAQPSKPLVSGPTQRAAPGQSVTFSCTAGGFFPKNIGVKWFKDKNRITSQTPQITKWQRQSYNMSSKVTVVLGEGDVLSQLICEVQHSTVPTLLWGMYQLGRVLRVSPSVNVRAEQMSPIEVNKSVNFTCHVKGFYPADVSVSWLENGMKMKVKNNSQISMSSKGLFELRSWVEVQATEEKDGSVFTCLVVHDAQAPLKHSVTLWITSPYLEGSSKQSQMDNDVTVLLLLFGILLEKVLLSGLLFFLFKHMKLNMSGMVPCPAPSQPPVPPGGSQGLATTSHL